MEKSIRFKVYPTQYVRGFVATYCHTIERAMHVREQMEEETGVEWRVKNMES